MKTNSEKWQGNSRSKSNSGAGRDGKPFEKRDVKSILKGSRGAAKFNNDRPARDDNRTTGNSDYKRKEDGRPAFGDRKPFGDRDNKPSFGDRKPFGDRDSRPSFGDRKPFGDRDSKPSFGDRKPYGDRDSRPSFGDRKPFGDRDSKPSFGDRKPYGDRDSRPSFGDKKPYGDRDSRPSFGDKKPYGDRDSKPSFGDRKPYGDRDSRPSFGDKKPYGERDSKPSFGDRKPYGDRDSRPSFGDKKPYGERDRKPSFGDRKPYGDRDSRPSFGDKKPYGERDSKPSFGDRKPYGDRDNRPSFGDKKPYGERDSKPSFGDRKPYGDRDSRPSFGDKKPYEKKEERTYNTDENGDKIYGRIFSPSDDEPRIGKLSFKKPAEPVKSEFTETRYDNKKDGVTFRKPVRRADDDYDPNSKYSNKKQTEYRKTIIDPTKPVRLNKFLANAGICSRREADEYIQAGVISVNGEIVTEMGVKVLLSDKVMFHDQTVQSEKKVYLLLNKPKDCVTTSEDTHDRLTVLDLVKNACSERIYPVGRLDRNTTGVLLLTNDGDLASKLTHPKYDKKKIYHITLDKKLDTADFDAVLSGVTLEDGVIKADALEYVNEEDFKQIGIEIHSGQNRVVRRIFEKLGYKVVRLDRVYFAGLTKKNLPRGKYRFLSEREVNMLKMGAHE